MTGLSTVAIGTAFEHHAAHFLNTDLRMAIRRVGGKGDRGVDLRGYWWLPKPRRRRKTSKSVEDGYIFCPPPGLKNGIPNRTIITPLRVIVQCKAEGKVLGPAPIRELEGSVSSLTSSDLTHVGVVVSSSGFSVGALGHASRSKLPLLMVHLPRQETEGEEGIGDGEEVVEDEEVVSVGGEEGGSSSSSTGRDYGPPPRIDVTSLWWNKAFSAILPPLVELRRELCSSGASRVGIWYAGGRMGRYGEAAETDER